MIYTLGSEGLSHLGGDGPKMIDLLQMREKYLLQDRIEVLGPVRHSDVRNVGEPTNMTHDVYSHVLG